MFKVTVHVGDTAGPGLGPRRPAVCRAKLPLDSRGEPLPTRRATRREHSGPSCHVLSGCPGAAPREGRWRPALRVAALNRRRQAGRSRRMAVTWHLCPAPQALPFGPCSADPALRGRKRRLTGPCSLVLFPGCPRSTEHAQPGHGTHTSSLRRGLARCRAPGAQGRQEGRGQVPEGGPHPQIRLYAQPPGLSTPSHTLPMVLGKASRRPALPSLHPQQASLRRVPGAEPCSASVGRPGPSLGPSWVGVWRGPQAPTAAPQLGEWVWPAGSGMGQGWALQGVAPPPPGSLAPRGTGTQRSPEGQPQALR